MAQFGLKGRNTELVVDMGPDSGLTLDAGEGHAAEFSWYFARQADAAESFHYHNAASCPDCGYGMIRLGSCFHCPSCGYSSCNA